MKKKKHLNGGVALLIIASLFTLCSHLEYKQLRMEKEVEEANIESEAEYRFYEYHEGENCKLKQ